MNHKDWKNKAVFGRLMESFGYGEMEENNDALEEVVEPEEEEALEEGEDVAEGCGDQEPDHEPDALAFLDEDSVRKIVREAFKKTLDK